MKLLAPIAAFIAAASAGQVYTGHSAESYAHSAEQYQSALELQQHGLYSHQSQAPQVFEGHEAAYSSRPAGEKTARILAYNSENNGHQYQYSYETENGIKAEEAGQTSEHGTVAHGAYSYKGDDGQTYTVTYTADEHGFHPQGAHLPTPPPIPEEIQKSLEQNAKDEAAGIFDDGKYKEQSGEGHGYQQYDASYQSVGYQAPSHASGADLAYRAHASNAHTGHASAAELMYHAPSHSSGSQLSFHAPSSHASSQSVYHIPTGHASGADLAYHASLGHSSSASSFHALTSHSTGAQLSLHTPTSTSHSGSQILLHSPSVHSSAQVAYHAPSGHGSGAQIAYHAPTGHASGAQIGYHAPTGHVSSAQIGYHAPTGHASGAQLAYHDHH